jgi:hypothetical protein
MVGITGGFRMFFGRRFKVVRRETTSGGCVQICTRESLGRFVCNASTDASHGARNESNGLRNSSLEPTPKKCFCAFLETEVWAGR